MDSNLYKRLRLWYRKNHSLAAVFFLVFGIRFAYTLAVQYSLGSQAFFSFSDAHDYVLLAENLLGKGMFSVMQVLPFLPDSLRTPLYPFLLAGFSTMHIPLAGFVLFQNALAGVVGVLLVRLGRLIFRSSAVGVLAALLYAFEPASVYWNGLVMPDGVFAFLVVLSLYWFVKKQWYPFALGMGLATLARPIGIYFFSVFILFAAYATFRRKGSVARFMKNALAAVAIFLLVISPWVIRNKMVFNTYELSSVGWVNINFPLGRFARAHGLPYEEPEVPEGFFPTGAENVRRAVYIYRFDFRHVPFYKQQFYRIVTEQPIAYAFYLVQSMARSLSGHDYEYMVEYVVAEKLPRVGERIGSLFVTAGNAAWLLLYAFALFGLFIREHREWKIFLLLLIAWNVFLVGLASGGSWGGRYNLPVAPMMFLLASYGMYVWCGMVKSFYVRHSSRI